MNSFNIIIIWFLWFIILLKVGRIAFIILKILSKFGLSYISRSLPIWWNTIVNDILCFLLIICYFCSFSSFFFVKCVVFNKYLLYLFTFQKQLNFQVRLAIAFVCGRPLWQRHVVRSLHHLALNLHQGEASMFCTHGNSELTHLLKFLLRLL